MADPGHPGMDRSIPHDDRWPLLKEVIIDLYINKGMTIPEMANHMKLVYDFDAQQPHYRYRLKLWKVHKRIKAKEKEQMIVQHARRQNPSATTSDITVHKGGIHKKLSDAQKTQLRRYLKRKLESESLPNISPGLDAAIWFHNLFMFSFMSAKYYGRGPTRWDAELIAARSLGGLTTDGASHQARALPDISNSAQAAIWDDSLHPTMLCRWSIHHEDEVGCDDGVDAPSPPHAPQAQDIEDETTWMPWEGNQSSSLGEILQEGMTSGSFTKATTDLPVTSSTFSAALERSKDQLEAEAFALAIASGNHGYLSGLKRFDLERLSEELGDLFPFHLAATHLRGATSCCLIADYLVQNMDEEHSVQPLNRNDLSHTILDSLMITILRSHTSVSPAIVCEALGKAGRFPGEGIDVCGRWDLDSPCVRRLFASGRTSVPMSWKHPFCHTSVQAVCHFITALFPCPHSPDINLESGIFLRRCCCGEKLRPRPLHTLVMVAYCLASHGAPGETLFGAIAVLTCMLVHNANPLDEADLAIPLLFFPGGTPDTGNCQHTPMTPIALAHALQGLPHHQWTSEVRLGWDVFVMTMKLAAAQRSNDEGMGASESFACEHYYDSYSYYDINNNTYCASPGLGRIWATIQAELVTYRRLGEEDAWISTNFDLRHLRQGLELGSDVSFMPFVSSSMIKDFSRCGWFVFGDEREDRADYRSITIRPMPRAQDLNLKKCGEGRKEDVGGSGYAVQWAQDFVEI
ncbi:hypothetical protein ACKVWC_003289 [Pyricularia oryzae]